MPPPPPSSLTSPVPSQTLLRFLRSQSEQLFLGIGPVPGGTPLRRIQARASNFPQKCIASRSPAQATTRRLCTSVARRDAVMQAGIWDLDSVLPKSMRKYRSKLATTTDQPEVRRYGSWKCKDGSENQEVWHERLWGSRARREINPLQPDDLPHSESLDDMFMFNSRRQLSAKSALEPRLRCTEVDENGKVILVDGEFKKSELIAKYGLLPRDLRKIDSSNLPHILVRPAAILLNLLHLKVLIKHDRVLLFDVYGSKTSYPQSAFMYDLQGKLQQKQAPGAGGLPYEFRALEAVMMSVTSELEADFETVREPVLRVLSELEEDITRDKLRMLLVLSKKVSTFEQKAKLVRDAIDELLEADDDLAAMYLTEKTHDIYRGEDDHTEVEMLLESYHKVCDEVAQEAGSLVSGIRNTEEIIRAILDANRNSLMLLELKFSIGTLGLAMGTFLAGLYGMNLENFIEETNWGFGAVTGVSALFSLLVCWYGLVKLRKVQRVKFGADNGARVGGGGGLGMMMKRDGGSAAGNYPPFLLEQGATEMLEARNRERLQRLRVMRQMSSSKKRSWF